MSAGSFTADVRQRRAVRLPASRGEDCAEVQSIQGWNDSVCDTHAKPFICEDYAAKPPDYGDGVVSGAELCERIAP